MLISYTQKMEDKKRASTSATDTREQQTPRTSELTDYDQYCEFTELKRDQAREWERMRTNRYRGASQTRTRTAELPKKAWYVTEATSKMFGFSRLFGKLEGKDLRQEWSEEVTSLVINEVQGNNTHKWEVNYEQVDAIDTNRNFEFQLVQSIWPAKRSDDKL